MNPQFSSFLSRRLIDRRDGHRRKVLAQYDAHLRHDFFARHLIETERNEALARLLNHARENVPFYRERLAAQPPIEPVRARAVLASLPVLRRSDIQADPARFVCSSFPAVEDATGGSTGTPMRFLVDSATQRAREASMMWSDHLAGWRYGDRIAMLWGSDRDVKSAGRALRSSLRWLIENRRWFNAFNMGEAEMAAAHKAMVQFQPHLIVAYANTAFEFCRWLEKNDIPARYPMTAVVTSAEVLRPEARETIQRVMGRQVFDRYGNRETGAIAAECEAHSGLHVNELDFVVELDGSDPRRFAAPLLLTYLHNYAMPLIRYDTGDLATWSQQAPCSCGRTTARLSGIVGRQSDIIRTRGGRQIHGEWFTHLFYSAAGMQEFQFVQESLDHYRLLIVGDRAACGPQEAGWRQRISLEVGLAARVDIEYVDKIPTTSSGKRRFTLSNIPPA